MKMDHLLGILDIDQYDWIDSEVKNREKVQESFFISIFFALGYLSKLDGKVSNEETTYALVFMDGLNLSKEHKEIAFHFYKEGSQSGFQLIEKIVTAFKNKANEIYELKHLYLEILLNIIYSDRESHVKERERIRAISNFLGISKFEFNTLENQVKTQHNFKSRQENESSSFVGTSYREACDYLGVPYNAKLKDIKTIYRKLVSKYHPDKLIAKGLPEEMIKIATDKSASIHFAYDVIIKELS